MQSLKTAGSRIAITLYNVQAYLASMSFSG